MSNSFKLVMTLIYTHLNGFKYCYLTLKNYLHTVKWFQVLQFNNNNSIIQVFLSNLILIISLHTVKWFQALLFSRNNST